MDTAHAPVIIYADIVGFSVLDEQKGRQLMDLLFREIYHFLPQHLFSATKSLYLSDTGDGFLLMVEEDVRVVLGLALYLTEKIQAQDQKIRFGLHSGREVARNRNFLGQEQIAGLDLVTGRRVLEAADDNHILCSEHFKENLCHKTETGAKAGKNVTFRMSELGLESLDLPLTARAGLKQLGEYKITFRELPPAVDKHDKPLHLYNIYTSSANTHKASKKCVQAKHGCLNAPGSKVILRIRSSEHKPHQFQLFLEQLRTARKVVMFGITNESVVETIGSGLLKNAAWEEFKIVFLDTEALRSVQDNRDDKKRQKAALKSLNRLQKLLAADEKLSKIMKVYFLGKEEPLSFKMTHLIYEGDKPSESPSEKPDIMRIALLLPNENSDIEPVVELTNVSKLYPSLENWAKARLTRECLPGSNLVAEFKRTHKPVARSTHAIK